MQLENPSIRSTRPIDRNDTIDRARLLASQIEELLTAVLEVDACYSTRLAQGMTRSLIDQLDEIERSPMSGTTRAYKRSV